MDHLEENDRIPERRYNPDGTLITGSKAPPVHYNPIGHISYEEFCVINSEGSLGNICIFNGNVDITKKNIFEIID